MSGFLQRTWDWKRCALCAAVAGLCCASGWAARTRVPVDPWTTAVTARQVFEAEPAGTHTRAEYTRVMDAFRAIYHAAPGDVHAARAVAQVAELLAEQGRELHDAKSLENAAGQYDFLQQQYPQSVAAKESRKAAGELRAEMMPARHDAVVVVSAEKPMQGSLHSVRKSAASGRDDRVVVAKKADAGQDERVGVAKSTDAGREDRPVVDAEKLESAEPISSVVPASDTKAMAQVTGIRHWSTASYTRVAIDLGDEVEYQAARVENPDSIFFDLHHAKLAPQLAGKSFTVTDDGFLTKIRAAQFSDEVTRVVLDVHEVADYSAFLLPNPYRLIIDIHGKAGVRDQGSGIRASGAESVVSSQPVEQAAPVVRATPEIAAAGAVSSLPPMPVTDGSAAFGLPAKKTEASTKNESVAAPRVVIPSRPTTAKPVPNTVTTHSSETGTEVAAVSSQPGKVEATSRPTSQPIASKGREQPAAEVAKGDHYRKPVRGAGQTVMTAHVAGTPVEAAPPTADGETSLVRALGLKIGRIVIDAGHGGHDSGTLGVGGIEEKDVVLDVALRLGKLLHDRLGAEIVYTRADDTFIPLETRTAIANKAQADLFISVHANSSQDASARGVEVYYLNFTSDPDAMKVAGRENAVSTQSVHELSDLVKKIALKDKIDESRELASDVDTSLYNGLTKGNDGLKNRGVKKAPFVVLIGANMPSILAEISFVTNPDDAEQLARPGYRQRVAESLYGGVARYAAGINGGKTAPRTDRAAK